MIAVEKLAVIGVGLIGGSFALSLRASKVARRVVGVGRNPANVRLALERGVIDAAEADPAVAVRDADLVMIATPVAQFAKIFSLIGPNLHPGAIVTDTGSTKRDVIAAARGALGKRISQFVPGHPIAGAEHSGVAAASAELFKGKRVVLSPLAENKPQDVERVSALWKICGAKVSTMAPEEHDEVLAAVSHLPHLLAFALVHEIAGRGNAAQLFGYAAGGFRDFTRIASSHPEMWRDVCMANRDRLIEELSRFSGKLDHVKRLLDDPAALEKLFAEARAARDEWIRSS